MTKKRAKTVAQQLQFAQHINHQAERLAALGYWEWDIVEDRLTYCSEGYARMLDMTVEDVLAAEANSEMTYDFIHPDDRQRYIDMEEEANEAGVGIDIEYRLITAKGFLRHFHEISEVVKDDAGTIIRTSGIMQDITESKRQQEELRRTLADARRAETMAKLGTYTWNWVEDRLESCSEEYARILDLTIEEVLNIHHSSEADFATIHPDDREAFKAVEAEALARGEGFEVEYRALLSNGGIAHMRLVCEVELDDQGDVIRSMGSIQDITEQVLLQEQLRQALKTKAIGQLTGGVAHDFNNMLMVIMGNLDMAMEILGDSSPATELLARALQASERGATLTRHLLAFARKQSLKLETVDLQGLILGMKELLQSTLGETIRVEIQDSGQQWLCETDATQFESAILNLAINARDAMPDGGALHIGLDRVLLDKNYASAHETVRAGPHIRLSVSDTGLGMPLDVQAQAFEPFFTTKDVGEGTGLGLSMVYGFLKQCLGHASIYSEPGEGTVVKLYLPHNLEGSVESPVLSLEQDVRGNDEIILVVEDDPQVRKLAVLFLHDLGYRTMEAEDSREALHLLSTESEIVLLFSDVVLPGGTNGVELAEEARRSYPDLKVLFTSGYTGDTAQHWGMAGFELLEKPYTKSQLASRLGRTLISETPAVTDRSRAGSGHETETADAQRREPKAD